MDIVKDGILYIPIFGEMATFLVENSTFKVCYVPSNDDPIVELTKENVKEFVDKHEDAWKRRVFEGTLYMMRTLPDLKIETNTNGYKLNSEYRGMHWDFLTRKRNDN